MDNSNKYVFRSLMFVPGHNEKLLDSASKSDADILLLDLEDSVQPKENKRIARNKIKQKVNEGKFKKHNIFPRVNDRESGFLLQDVYELTIEGVDGFTYPKAYTGQDIYFFDKLLETIEYEKGFPVGTFKIIPLIETSAAVLNAQDICKASPRVVAIAFGGEDFITDLGGIHDKEGQSFFTARSMISMAAKANNVAPIDTVHINVHDLEDLEKNLKLSKRLGFQGMLVLNPKELPLVHKYFSPSLSEINDAKEMLKLASEAKKEGKGVTLKNKKFIGPPMIQTAKNIIEQANLIEQKNKRKK